MSREGEYLKTYVVKVAIPEGMGVMDMAEYIRNALKSEHGLYTASDPRSDVDPDHITVRPVPGYTLT